MKWFIGCSEAAPAAPSAAQLPADHPPVPNMGSGAKCPIDHSAMAKPAPPPAAAKCPVDHSAMPSSAKPAASGAQCPIDHSGMSMGAASALGSAVGAPGSLNPVNHMPVGLSATDRAPGQTLDLSIERTLSSIPRPQGDDVEDTKSSVWEYPSPQQFYNALVRKGWETPEESIQMVVDIHNFINEGAWDEVMKWEKRLPGGEHAMLARFQGKPGQISPKARMNLWLGQIFPSKFNSEPPFDRHDWVVTRPILDAEGKPTKEEAEQRYVIDYYSAPPDEDGNPVFSIDVRPALDSFGAVSQRVQVAVEEWMQGQQ